MGKDFQKLVEKIETELYDEYLIQFRTDNKLLGGWPKNPIEELALLKARFNQGLIREETYQAALDAVQEQSSDDPEAETESAKLRAWTGFRTDEKGIYIGSRQVKAAMRESASVLGLIANTRGSKQIVQHAFFAYGTEQRDCVRMYREPYGTQDRTLVMQPDGYEQLVAHVIGPQGPRSTIKFHDFVEDVYFECRLLVSDYKGRVKMDRYIAPLLVHMQKNGLGCSRSQGYGRLQLIDCDQVGTAKVTTKVEDVPNGKSGGTKRTRKEAVVQEVSSS